MGRDRQSIDSLREASIDKTKFSGHGNARGVEGFKDSGDILSGPQEFLSETGQTKVIPRRENHFDGLEIHLAWNNVIVESKGFFGRLLSKATNVGVDLDLGCLYELKDGTRGSVQAFGNIFGAIDQPPFIHHTGDERTGNTPGVDEALEIKGQYWENIKRFLVYAYVYQGPTEWKQIKPEMRIAVTGEPPMIITPSISRDDLPICVLAEVDNLDGGLRLINRSEYFSSQPAMDRAYGYGLQWEDGAKN